MIAGWDQSPGRNGVYWKNGVEHFLGTPNQSVFVNEASFVTRDGSTVTGGQSAIGSQGPDGAWMYYTTNDSREIIHVGPNGGNSIAYRANDAANVISGFDRIGGSSEAKFWTPQLGWVNLTDFLNSQGLYAQGSIFGWSTALSADGRIWGGTLATIQGVLPTRIEIPKAIVCHKAPGSPNAKAKNLDVSFPDGFEDHLAHGDTVGICQIGGE